MSQGLKYYGGERVRKGDKIQACLPYGTCEVVSVHRDGSATIRNVQQKWVVSRLYSFHNFDLLNRGKS